MDSKPSSADVLAYYSVQLLMRGWTEAEVAEELDAAQEIGPITLDRVNGWLSNQFIMSTALDDARYYLAKKGRNP